MIYVIPRKVYPREKNLNLILSIKKSSINKNVLGFKKDKKSRNNIDHKGKKRLVYKCTHCKRLGHLEPFCFDKLKRCKGNNLRSSRTNVFGPRRYGH